MNVVDLPFCLVDAFASEPATGNAAGVVILPGEFPDAVLQKIAREVNHPETAFLRLLDNRFQDNRPQENPTQETRLSEPGWSLRWFTPTTEVNLCGHATLAAAWVLFETRGLTQAEFQTRSGPLHSLIKERQVLLDFPRQDIAKVESPGLLKEALFPAGSGDGFVLGVWHAGEDWLIELDNPERVLALNPGMEKIAQLGRRGLIVTAKGGPDSIDFVSRFFAPQSGVPEDPVTGSAHCALAPFWGSRLGKTKMVGRQCSSRGGIVGVELIGKRVILSGKAITTIRGNFLIPQLLTR